MDADVRDFCADGFSAAAFSLIFSVGWREDVVAQLYQSALDSPSGGCLHYHHRF
ncbi:MAG: hypothetical protein OXL37_16675 [Chloroflexota bacterium]|nr:hypothetical protein [Chloroflexota bacterium]MDE2960221.1 hypothetical protein [Chloroflexota bacterium]